MPCLQESDNELVAHDSQEHLLVPKFELIVSADLAWLVWQRRPQQHLDVPSWISALPVENGPLISA
jgi:hypothetical protein